MNIVNNTELLTNKGLIHINDILPIHKIAVNNFDKEIIEWTNITSLSKSQRTLNVCEFKTNKSEGIVPSDFIVNTISQNKKIKYKDTAKSLLTKCRHIRTSFITNPEEYIITDNNIKLAAWIYTDGSVLKNGAFTIYQSKPEMVIKIRNLLNSLNLKFSEYKRQRDVKAICGKKLKKKTLVAYRFYIFKDQIDFIKDKYTYDAWVSKLSKRQFDIFIHELVLGDGSKHKSSPDSSWMMYGIKAPLKQLQLLMLQYGYSGSFNTYRDVHYRLNINVNKNMSKFNSSKNCKNILNYNYTGLVHNIKLDTQYNPLLYNNGKFTII